MTKDELVEQMRDALIHYTPIMPPEMRVSSADSAARAALAIAMPAAFEMAAEVVGAQTDYTTITPFVHRERALAAIIAEGEKWR